MAQNENRATAWLDKRLLVRIKIKAAKEGGTLGAHFDRAVREYLKRK